MNPPMNRPKSGYGACARAEGDSPSAPPATKMSKSISQRLSGAAAIKAPRKTERLALIHSTQAAFSYYYVLVQHFLSKIIIFLQLRRQSPSIINMNYACDPLGSPRYIYGIPPRASFGIGRSSHDAQAIDQLIQPHCAPFQKLDSPGTAFSPAS